MSRRAGALLYTPSRQERVSRVEAAEGAGPARTLRQKD
jgi:hypothetical protein